MFHIISSHDAWSMIHLHLFSVMDLKNIKDMLVIKLEYLSRQIWQLYQKTASKNSMKRSMPRMSIHSWISVNSPYYSLFMYMYIQLHQNTIRLPSFKGWNFNLESVCFFHWTTWKSYKDLVRKKKRNIYISGFFANNCIFEAY